MTSFLRPALTAGLLLAVLTACTPATTPSSDAPPVSASAVSYADAFASASAVVEAAKTAVDANGGTGGWQSITPAENGPCATDAAGNASSTRGFTDTWESAPLDDSSWQVARTAVETAAADAGFTDVTVREDASGRHNVLLSSPTGATLEFATGASTRVMASTGCAAGTP